MRSSPVFSGAIAVIVGALVIPTLAQTQPPSVLQDEPLQRINAVRACPVDAEGRIAGPWCELGAGTAGLGDCVTAADLVFDGAGVGNTRPNGCGAPAQGPFATYLNGGSIGDMVLDSETFNGRRAAYIELVVYHAVTEPLFVRFRTFENVAAAPGDSPIVTGAYPGVLVAFHAPGGALAAGAYLVAVDLCTVPNMWLQLPISNELTPGAPARGAFEVVAGRSIGAGDIIAPQTRGSFGVYGTNPLPHTSLSHPGSQNPALNWDDDNPLDGSYNPARNPPDMSGECYDYGLNPGCNVERCVAISFWAVSQAQSCAGWLTGDAVCDGQVDNFDIDGFVLALSDLTQYATLYPGCSRVCVADLNRDGRVDNFDIDPFVACISEPPAAGQPCP